MVIAVAVADNTYRPAPYKQPSYDYADTDPVYNFNYNVYNNDNYEHQNFRQNEDRNGYETHGEYSVQLPDGRIQTVTYQVPYQKTFFLNTKLYNSIIFQVNGDSGFIADVKYEGEAKYEPYHPKPKPTYAPAPAYKPHPTYAPKPAPTYKPRPTYAPKPAPTYAPKPAPTYAPKPAPTYAPKPAPTYAPAPKREYGPVRFNPFG